MSFSFEDLKSNGVYTPDIKLDQKIESTLPILIYKEKIKEILESNETVIIVGETGSGKSTQLPLILLEQLQAGEKILVSQPRRLPAISLAKYLSKKTGTELGDKIGYEVRFDDHTNEGTQINFVTDGILIREIQTDPLLENYSVIMIDEAHERSLNIDFCLGMLKMVQEERMEQGIGPLKIVVTSATIEKDRFTNFFDYSESLEVPGRTFPIKEHFLQEDLDEREQYHYDDEGNSRRWTDPLDKYIGKSKNIVFDEIIDNGREGDILIFMPGQEEIKKTIEKIEDEIRKRGEAGSYEILPCYGQMSPSDQEKIMAPSSKRKIIISTNIAETSLTIEGVKYVIDTGLIKETDFNSGSGITELNTVEHSQSGCRQRWGRSGRTGPGEVWCLYTRKNFEKREKHQKPEILRSDLSNVVLMMKKLGIKDVVDFDFIDKPNPENVLKAIEDLKLLGALDENENITKLGETMAQIPLEPKISRMVVEAEKFGCIDEVCTIAAFLGGKNVFSRPKNKELEAKKAHQYFMNPESDFITLLNVFKEYEENHFNSQWARENFLNYKVLEEARDIKFQLLRILARNKIKAEEGDNKKKNDDIEKSIASGLVANMMTKKSSISGVYYNKLENYDGNDYYIHPSSSLFASSMMKDSPDIVTSVKMTKTSRHFIQGCQRIKPDWIKDIAPHLVTYGEKRVIFDRELGSMVIKRDMYLKNGRDLGLEKNEDLEGEDLELITKIFLKEIDRISNPPKIHLENAKKVRNIMEYENRYKIKPKKDYNLYYFYLEKLNGRKCTSFRDFERYKDDLTLNLEEFLDLDVLKKIESDYEKISNELGFINIKIRDVLEDENNPFDSVYIKIIYDDIFNSFRNKTIRSYGSEKIRFDFLKESLEAQEMVLRDPSLLESINKTFNKYKHYKKYFEEAEKFNGMLTEQEGKIDAVKIKDIYGKLRKIRKKEDIRTLNSILWSMLGKVEFVLSNKQVVDSIHRKEKVIRKYVIQPQKPENFAQEKSFFIKNILEKKSAIDKIIEILSDRDGVSLDRRDIAAEIIKKSSSAKTELSKVQREAQDSKDEDSFKSLEGKYNNAFSVFKKIVERRMPLLIHGFNENWIEDFEYLNAAIEYEMKENQDAQEFIAEGIISEEELIKKIKEKIIEDIPKLIKIELVRNDIDYYFEKTLEEMI
uniref:RNA helicase n=1 Tax=candidate division CPR3 bacterium TaxID=2268181 RepID=A0A7C4R642_UNCC3